MGLIEGVKYVRKKIKPKKLEKDRGSKNVFTLKISPLTTWA